MYNSMGRVNDIYSMVIDAHFYYLNEKQAAFPKKSTHGSAPNRTEQNKKPFDCHTSLCIGTQTNDASIVLMLKSVLKAVIIGIHLLAETAW